MKIKTVIRHYICEKNIPKTEAVVSVIAVGYTDSEIVRPKRKSVEDFAKFYED